MGDPGRGQEKILAAWVMPVGNAGMTLIIIGLTLCVASPLARRLRGVFGDDPLLPR